MKKPIRRTAVIGAGVMGSGIAAHFANAGLEVLLLDIVPPNLSDAEKKDRAKRNGFAAGGLEKALKARPAAFFHKDNARLVSVGNTEDDLEKLKDCDLVIEAIIEKMEAKQALLEKLEKIVPAHCIVASNTSGLRIAEMTKGRSENFKKHFVVLHFFNPVRYMKLLEIVAGPETDKGVLDKAVRFAEDVLGKGVVFGKDTPNFVGNRIGAHAMMATIHQMLADGLAPEDVDNVTGTPMAHPKSASFRTADLVGLDTFAHVADNCYQSLTNDEDRKVFEVPDYIRKMVDKKLLGDKTKGGFFKRGADKQIQTLDPKTLEYRPKGGDEGIKAATKAIAKSVPRGEGLVPRELHRPDREQARGGGHRGGVPGPRHQPHLHARSHPDRVEPRRERDVAPPRRRHRLRLPGRPRVQPHGARVRRAGRVRRGVHGRILRRDGSHRADPRGLGRRAREAHPRSVLHHPGEQGDRRALHVHAVGRPVRPRLREVRRQRQLHDRGPVHAVPRGDRGALGRGRGAEGSRPGGGPRTGAACALSFLARPLSLPPSGGGDRHRRPAEGRLRRAVSPLDPSIPRRPFSGSAPSIARATVPMVHA